MTAVPHPEGVRLPRLLAESDQLTEWATTLERMDEEGRTVAVAHSPDRQAEAVRLASRFGGQALPLELIPALDELERGDLLAIVSSSTHRPLRETGGLDSLHSLLGKGVLIWGITGPRPNSVSHFCHDVVAVPTREPDLLLSCHRLVVDRLVASVGNLTRMRERSGSSVT